MSIIKSYINKIELTSGGIEVLKLIAISSMTVDHVNKYLFNGTVEYMFEIGRIAMPIFFIVMAYNISQTSNQSSIKKIEKRLFVFSIISSIPYLILGTGVNNYYLPLNIMATLFFVAVVCHLICDKRFIYAALVFVMSGYFVEYGHIGLFVGIASFVFFKERGLITFSLFVLSVFSLYKINGNFFALASLPIIIIFGNIKIQIPRLKFSYYVYYPAHLFVFYLIRIPMRNAGYLFF